jgi:hypothetical protein
MSDRIEIPIDTKTLDGYNLFIKCKKLPRYTVSKNIITTDTMSYGFIFGDTNDRVVKQVKHGIEFDYQDYVIQKALDRQCYAPFLDCGLGKTIIELVWIHSVINRIGGKGILLCPLSVVEDIQRECMRLYGYRMSNLKHEEWKTDIAIVNYEGCYDFPLKDLSAICVDESSILKSGDGKTCEHLTKIASYCKFRLACSATPSPNDQTEYASHAVFLGISSTLKEFYSRFFVKDGTEWRMKGHAKGPFYDFLKSWACYIHSPSSLGFERGAELAEGPEYIVERTYPTGDYYPEGNLFSDGIDLFNSKKIFTGLRTDKTQDRFKLAFDFIKDKKGIVWCGRNAEEEMWAQELGGTLVTGKTPIEKRIEIVDSFRNGDTKHIVSKGSVLGFGINIPEAEAHLDTGYNLSFEEHYQKIRRSHRYGRKNRLKVYIPVSEPERPIWDRLNKKLQTFNSDVVELQNRFFS